MRTELTTTSAYSIFWKQPQCTLHFAAVGTEQHVSILALATRSVYELDLRARHVLASSENMVAWQSEAVLDQIEIYESLLRIPNSPEGVKPIPS